jgi:hypothetical protein
VLPSDAVGPIKALAQRRAGRPIAVTGFGEAKDITAAAQSAALPLALARARAVANQLIAAGVPIAQIRLYAEAAGHGAAARIVN